MKMNMIHFPKLAIALLLCTLVVSCSKEDVAPKYADLIIGKWYITEAVYDNGTTYFPQNSCEKKSAFEFTKSGEFSQIIYTQSGDFCLPNILEGTYIMLEEEKKIMVSDDTDSEVLDILKLDTKVMELYLPHSSFTYKLEKAF
jgi:hypothetical protein